MRKSNYDKFPQIDIAYRNGDVCAGYDQITGMILARIGALNRDRAIVAVDCYPGVLDAELLPELQKRLAPALTLRATEANLAGNEVEKMIKFNLTDDRVRGVMSHFSMTDFFDAAKLQELARQAAAVSRGIVLIYGVGASLIIKPDILVYADLARWEIQLRYRQGKIANWLASNYQEDFLRMYKRGFFVDWRVADRHKSRLFERIDFLLDTNVEGRPKMMSGMLFRKALAQTVRRPFRVVPYFDAGPWGGQWMKEVCNLDRSAPNYAWCFDCVPEENSLLFACDDVRIEIPAIDLVLTHGAELLGEKVQARFGDEFPIRFDLLDTMGGGNLSLQVHPDTRYIQDNFGMHYTQDESYYILDAGPDACVYLGLKDDADKAAMLRDLEAAQKGGSPFDAERYVNRLPARQHDHFLIPAGTIHCSGADTMVLEISATPYIFTFKLWDWGRLGLDGRPRPIHLEHGTNVINYHWRTDTILDRHVNCITRLAEGEGWHEERTGLHEREFIETRRIWFSRKVCCRTDGSVNVLNLVEGEEAIVESPTGAFAPFVVHYAESFIVPASIDVFTLRPHGPAEGSRCAVIRAGVRI